MTLTHGSLFSGIGGFELGAMWAGIPTLWNCEIEPFNRKILSKHFPESHQYEDIRDLRNPPYVDIISGGFPCQPFSLAGNRKGREDNRFLWPEMLRVISEGQPKYIIGENVPGILSSDGGMVFEQVCSDLETQGYEVQAFNIASACSGGISIRERVWFLAYRDSQGLSQRVQTGLPSLCEAQTTFTGREPARIPTKETWLQLQTEPGIRGGDIRVPNRVDRIKGIGNAIDPRIAKELFGCIKEFDSHTKNLTP